MGNDLDDVHIPDTNETRRQMVAIETATDKYVYFLLATAAACIAYGMQRTSTSSFNYVDLVLFAAWACWAVSFWYGTQNRMADIRRGAMALWRPFFPLALKADTIKNPSNPNLAKAREVMESFLKDFDESASNESKKKQASFDNQFWFLVYGAILFTAWHVVGMLRR